MPRFLYHTRRSAPLRKFINPTIPLSLHRYVMQVIAELCKSKDPHPDEEIVGEVIPALCALIHHQDTNIVVDSALTFSYLADGGSGQIQMIIDTGVVPFLVSLLGSKIVDVQSAALKAVGNLATGSDEQTQVILDCGALTHFAVLLAHSDKFITKETMWVVSNITAGSRKQIQAVIDAGLLPEIIRHLDKGVNFQIQKEAAWAVSNLTNSGSDIQITALVENNAIKPLCKLLTNEDDQMVQVCLDGISDILGSSRRNDPGTARMMIEECGGLEQIEVIQKSSRAEKKAYDILDRYFYDEEDGVNFQIQKEAAWAVSNLTNSGSDIQITALVENNAIKPLCKLLTNEDDQMVQVCLDGISDILGSSRRNDPGTARMMIEECGGLEQIEVIQKSSRAEKKAYDILDRYFYDEEDSDEVSSYHESQTHSDDQSNDEDQTIGHDRTIDEDPAINANPSINEGPPMDEDPSIEDLSIIEEPSLAPQTEQAGL